MKYERLTKETVGSFGYDLKDFEHKPKEFNDYDAFYAYKMAVKRLGELEDKIENGEIDYVSDKDTEIVRLTDENAELRARLEKAVELPYEVGSTVYTIHKTDEEDKINPWIDTGRAVSFSIDVKLWIYVRYNSGLNMWYTKDSFDKEVCITFEAAEARLKELKEERKDDRARNDTKNI